MHANTVRYVRCDGRTHYPCPSHWLRLPVAYTQMTWLQRVAASHETGRTTQRIRVGAAVNEWLKPAREKEGEGGLKLRDCDGQIAGGPGTGVQGGHDQAPGRVGWGERTKGRLCCASRRDGGPMTEGQDQVRRGEARRGEGVSRSGGPGREGVGTGRRPQTLALPLPLPCEAQAGSGACLS